MKSESNDARAIIEQAREDAVALERASDEGLTAAPVEARAAVEELAPGNEVTLGALCLNRLSQEEGGDLICTRLHGHDDPLHSEGDPTTPGTTVWTDASATAVVTEADVPESAFDAELLGNGMTPEEWVAHNDSRRTLQDRFQEFERELPERRDALPTPTVNQVIDGISFRMMLFGLGVAIAFFFLGSPEQGVQVGVFAAAVRILSLLGMRLLDRVSPQE